MDKHTASFSYTREILDSLDLQARDEIRRLGGNDLLEQILDILKVPAVN